MIVPSLPVLRIATVGLVIAVALALVVALRTRTAGDDEPVLRVTTTTPATVDSPPEPTTTAAPGQSSVEAPPEPPRLVGHYRPSVVATFPHDVWSFTQGLEWYEGALLESSGPPDFYNQRNVPAELNRSSLRLVEPETGEIITRVWDSDGLFAEGVTAYEGDALQITYESRALLVTDLDTLGSGTVERRDNAYEGEGWGLCYDGEHLVMSNGSPTLAFRNPETFEIERTVEVTINGSLQESLNELECVNGQVLANIWKENSILVIDPATGIVEATIDATTLVPEGLANREAVLNGIAHNPETGRLWMTGKLWPVMYEVDLVLIPDEPLDG